MNFLNRIIPIHSYAVGILNLAIIVSYLVNAVFIFMILEKFRINGLAASLASVAITMLSSQIILLEHGHYSLSLTCPLTIGWYLLIRYNETDRKLPWTIVIMLNNLIWTYTHPYIGVTLMGFTLLSTIYHEWNSFKTFGHLVVQILLPILIVVLMIKLFDHHDGRMDWPFVTAYRSSLWTIFYSPYSLLKDILDQFISLIGLSVPSVEQHLWLPIGNYLGMATMIVLLIAFIKWLGSRDYMSLLKHEMSRYVFAAIIILLYSMAIPFRWFPDLATSIPFFTKFIALGRFAWLPYYVFTVLSFVLISNLTHRKKINWVMYAAAVMMMIESFGYHDKVSRNIGKYSNIFHEDAIKRIEALNALEKVDFGKYQAIIPIPYFHKWNGPFAFDGSARSEIQAAQLAYHTGIPLMSTFLSRPSIEEGKKIIQVFSGSLPDQNDLMDELNPEKPILILWTKEQLNEQEHALIAKSSLVFENGQFALHEIEVKDIFDYNSGLMKIGVEQAISEAVKHHLYDVYSTDSLDFLYYNDFEDRNADLVFRGRGAFTSVKNTHLLLFQSARGTFQPGMEYVLSFWFYNRLNQNTYCSIWIDELDPEGDIKSTIEIKPFASTIFDGDWAYNHHKFSVSDSTHSIKIYFQGQNLLDNRIFMDEFIIYDANVDLYRIVKKENSMIYIKNNLTVYDQ